MKDSGVRKPIRVITSSAPIRVCDNGGWTDTWFAEHGKVFNIAVQPGIEVQLEVFPRQPDSEPVVLCAENYGDLYSVHPDRHGWERHPLLEATIQHMGIPADCAIQAHIYSEVPGGCSTGTSAAVVVALVGALDRLRGGRLGPLEIAYAAHAVEVEVLKQQSGIQDQLCSVYGGINYIEIDRYPHARVSSLRVSSVTWWELERRLVLIYLGRSHASSAVHEKVIAELQNEGSDCQRLQDLRATADKSRAAVCAGDLAALGDAMIENTEAQGRLHPDLVSREAAQAIQLAREYGALGWKVNGAGGEGGSLTILGPALSHTKREMIRAIETSNSLLRHIPIYLSHSGLRVWEHVPYDGKSKALASGA